MQGTVKAVNVSRGFGFIEAAGFPKDLFFHVKSLDGNVPFDEQLVGRRVEFEAEDGERGPKAVNVRAARN